MFESVSKSWRDSRGLSRFLFLRSVVLGRIGVSRRLIDSPISKSFGSGSDGFGGHKELVLICLCNQGRRGSSRELFRESLRDIPSWEESYSRVEASPSVAPLMYDGNRNGPGDVSSL